MKIGNRVRVKNLDYFRDSVTQEVVKRDKKLIETEGYIRDINLGIFKVEFDDGKVEYFDGRELELAEKLKIVDIDMSFVSWQKGGKSIYGTEAEERYFVGDFRRGCVFKGTIELDDEEIERMKSAEKEGIRAVFDVFVRAEGDRRKNRR
ncbi:MAG: hypothetical protein KA120_05515 [Candidatus Goldbacteria bacterium]|nr:hypothetical protein [Candidatus Goldiibacteriota bacterium]